MIGLRPNPFSLVIFGASGDLTARKLLPALYHLYADGRLPEDFAIIGFARSPWNDEEFRAHAAESLVAETQDRGLGRFLQGLSYCQGEFQDEKAYGRLVALLNQTDEAKNTCGNRLFYLATPPETFESITLNLGKAGLIGHDPDCGWTRIIVEKPFGRDLNSARHLNDVVHRSFAEEQIYRIDHYLGKETVQNLLVTRFANGIFEPLWNHHFIDNVQITVAESLGVENRGGYYDQTGAAKDIIQNHMLQLLSLVAMEPPVAFSADAVREEKVKVLKAIRSFSSSEALKRSVRGQYRSGVVEGRAVRGYLEEANVDPASRRETFAALKLYVENWRWSGVPFYLFTGKRLPSRTTDIAIWFRKVPHLLFKEAATSEIEPNLLLIKIQPDEEITLRFNAKVPGTAVRPQSVEMNFSYRNSFRVSTRDAYERLLLDAMVGDQTLFTRNTEVEEAWRIVTSLVAGWEEAAEASLPGYPAGTWGPEEVADFLAEDGHHWHHGT